MLERPETGRERTTGAPGRAALRLAVLIDADNTSARIASGLFEAIARLGDAGVRRAYGDFTRPALNGWSAVLTAHAIVPTQTFAHVPGKNASDIALVIDAMDLLHAGGVEGFCLVSSDSDFTRLATRLREQGAAVYGFGGGKTPESFRRACRRFVCTETLPSAAPEPRGAGRPEAEAVPLLKSAIARLDGAEDGWVSLSAVGQGLKALSPGFDPRTYGHATLMTLLARTGAFEVRRGEGNHPFVRPAASG